MSRRRRRDTSSGDTPDDDRRPARPDEGDDSPFAPRAYDGDPPLASDGEARPGWDRPRRSDQGRTPQAGSGPGHDVPSGQGHPGSPQGQIPHGGINWGPGSSGSGGPVWEPGLVGSTWNHGMGATAQQDPADHHPDPASGERGSGDTRRQRTRRRSPGALIGPLAGAIGLAILLGTGVYALADRQCGGGDITLNVAAAPDIAPAVERIATAFDASRHTSEGKCVRAVVRASQPADVSTLLSGQGTMPGEAVPDVWIPDSSLWVTLVRSTPLGASNVSMTPTSVARTPIVVATSRAFDAKIRHAGIRPTWDMLLRATDALTSGRAGRNDVLPPGSVHLQILDPTRNAGGLGAVVMTHMLLQGDPDANAIFTQIIRRTQTSVSPNTRALFATFRQDRRGRAPVVIAPEQSVWTYNRSLPAVPASAIYPSEGMLSLDYPYTITTSNNRKVRAAEVLERAMSTRRAANDVHALGFRTPDGHLGKGIRGGLNPGLPRALPDPAYGDVTGVVQAWAKLSLRTRMLALIDVSGSMAAPVGEDITRMQATTRVAQDGLSTLSGDTEFGLWAFSTNLVGGQDYRPEVPVGPLSSRLGSATRRQAILGALGRLRPKPGGDTGLYDSVLAAFRSLQRTYQAGYYNTALVLTDGRNDDPHGISLDGLLRTLKKDSDPARPVAIVFIGFGPNVDMSAMQRIAAETNGAAYHATRPQEIRRIFLNTIARPICAPQCP